VTEFLKRPLLTVAEVASVLRTSERNVRDIIDRGEIEAIRVGVQWRIPRRELERLTGLTIDELLSDGQDKRETFTLSTNGARR